MSQHQPHLLATVVPKLQHFAQDIAFDMLNVPPRGEISFCARTPQVHQHTHRPFKDCLHTRNLGSLFGRTLLINADGINPQGS